MIPEARHRPVEGHVVYRPKASKRFTGGRCAHCRGPQIGYAAKGEDLLCHPDYGLDCYRLVTVYGHGMPCDCRGESSNPDNDRCYQCGYRRFEHLVDEALPQRFDFLGNPVPCWDFLEAPTPGPPDDPFGELDLD